MAIVINSMRICHYFIYWRNNMIPETFFLNCSRCIRRYFAQRQFINQETIDWYHFKSRQSYWCHFKSRQSLLAPFLIKTMPTGTILNEEKVYWHHFKSRKSYWYHFKSKQSYWYHFKLRQSYWYHFNSIQSFQVPF